MPSASLVLWQNNRMPRLLEIDGQCAAALALIPAQPDLVEENLRAAILLLSAHFQGYCRDLYAECATIVTLRVRPSLRLLVQDQFVAHRRLDHGNPNLANLRQDFERFGFTLDLPSADPANAARLNDLSQLNRWRNAAAHYGPVPSGMPLSLVLVRSWRTSCDGLASALDGIMYNELRRILRRAPW